MSRCRSCGAFVRWVLTERGRKMPVEPHEGGNRGVFVLRQDDALEDPVALAVPPDAFPDEPHYQSHFATCPERDRWRRR